MALGVRGTGRFSACQRLPALRCVAAARIIAVLAAICADMPRPAGAEIASVIQDSGSEVRRISVTCHKSRTITLSVPFTSAVVGAPEIADVLPMSDKVLYIQGRKPGTTNISVFGKDKQLLTVMDVAVSADTQHIAKSIHASVASPGIRITAVNDQVVLSGEARSAVDAERAQAIARAMMPSKDVTVINAMTVAPSQQVMLKVRFLEVNRSAAREIGVNWYGANSAGTRGFNTGLGTPSESSVGGIPLFQLAANSTSFASGSLEAPFGIAIASLLGKGNTLDVMLSALEKKGLVRSLAEPDLVALSGETASFRVGGEIPRFMYQGPLVAPTIDDKPYGVLLTFVPTVLSNGIINLRLSPSVRELDYTNAVVSGGIRTPAMTTRETQTTVELRDGQSFAISGLLKSESWRDIKQIPWAGSMPVLGALFRSTSYQQKETDLVVIVTPHLVAPAVPGQQLANPLDQRLPANDVDLFLMGQTDVRKKYQEYVTTGGELNKPYGHIMPMTQN